MAKDVFLGHSDFWHFWNSNMFTIETKLTIVAKSKEIQNEDKQIALKQISLLKRTNSFYK